MSDYVYHASFTKGIDAFRPWSHCGTYRAAVERIFSKAQDEIPCFETNLDSIFAHFYVIDNRAKLGYRFVEKCGANDIVDLVEMLLNPPTPTHIRDMLAELCVQGWYRNNKIKEIISQKLAALLINEKIGYLCYHNRVEDFRSLSYVIVDPAMFKIVQTYSISLADLAKNNKNIVLAMRRRGWFALNTFKALRKCSKSLENETFALAA